jgi:tight adherence protein B
VNLLAAWLTAIAAALLIGALTGAWPPARSHRESWRRRARRQQTPTGLGFSRRQFTILLTGGAVLVFAVVWAISGVWPIALLPAIGTAYLPRPLMEKKRAQRLMDLQRAWPDGLRDLVASISSGASLSRALDHLAISGPRPLRDAFKSYPKLSRAVGVVAALDVIKSDLAHPGSDRVLEVLILAHDRGGSIVVEILRDLAEATTRDAWAMEEIETLSLEQKINARIVFVIPWLVLIFMTVRPGPFREFYQSVAGGFVVLIGGAASLFGMWLVGRLGREPDEPRVFGGRAS